MDSRFRLKVQFDIYGETFNWDCSLNWTSDDPNKIDRRITEWFLSCHDKAYAKWQDEIYEQQTEQRAREQRVKELSELKRLKLKYPND